LFPGRRAPDQLLTTRQYARLVPARLSVTSRTLERRFKKAIGQTPLEYLQGSRIENTKRLLATTQLRLDGIAHRVGYEEPGSLRRIFVRELLAHEKDLTKHYDRVNAERRRLPMVKIEKNYAFDGPGGKRAFKALFEGRRQLIIYHFMFDPAWKKGCPSCTWYIDSLGDLSMLHDLDTTFALVSRAPRRLMHLTFRTYVSR
jgi:AraC-like DNA-binding protein